MPESPGNTIADVPGVLVGSAHDERVRTGVSVVLFDRLVPAAVDVRGGGPGTRETDALALGGLVGQADAFVLAGGSVYGLAAADTVCRRLGAAGRGFALVDQPGVPRSPIVPAAILYDLANGGEKDWGSDPPYARLAEEAWEGVGPSVRLGRVGAGYGALAGAHRGGLGSASLEVAGFTLGALAAVNPFGSPYVPGTRQFWAAPFERDREFGGRGSPATTCAEGLPPDTKLGAPPGTNTTIAAIATDAPLGRADLRRIAAMAQTGLGRAIRPAHGPTDGDTVFAASTAREGESVGLETVLHLGNAAADVLARAIARGVYEAEAPSAS